MNWIKQQIAKWNSKETLEKGLWIFLSLIVLAIAALAIVFVVGIVKWGWMWGLAFVASIAIAYLVNYPAAMAKLIERVKGWIFGNMR